MPNNQIPAWQALTVHAAACEKNRLSAMLADDPQRFSRFNLRLPGLLIDYSRQRVTTETIQKLVALATACNVPRWRDRMLSGDAINTSEKRAVLHTALRRAAGESVMVAGRDVMPDIHATLGRIENFTAAVHNGQWVGYSGKPVRTVINIGIGGSDLGPRMVVKALRNFWVKGINVEFVSNVDGSDLYNALRDADPETTMFLIASKTFTTLETMANARTARRWMMDHFKTADCVEKHFIALSTNARAVQDFGIAERNMFPFEDWVGGRYSLWSSIGVSIALAVGYGNFRKLLDGGNAMDRHFATAPLEQNAPVLLALLGIWNRNFQDAGSLAVLPYTQNLSLFATWLQQVDMESNGKSITRAGEHAAYQTGPIVFGSAGTDCQHSYFQLVHQGTDIIPCDFIAAKEPDHPWPEHHTMLLANLVAQADALAKGRSLADSGNDPQRRFDGNRPSTILLIDRLDPWHLGQLLALYEHKVFVQGIIWNINSFDQWGVELGKILAAQVMEKLTGSEPTGTIIDDLRSES